MPEDRSRLVPYQEVIFRSCHGFVNRVLGGAAEGPEGEVPLVNLGVADLCPCVKWTAGKRYKVERLLKENLRFEVSLGLLWRGKTHGCSAVYGDIMVHMKLVPTVIPDKAGVILDTEYTYNRLPDVGRRTPRLCCPHKQLDDVLRQLVYLRCFSRNPLMRVRGQVECPECGTSCSHLRVERDLDRRLITYHFRTRRILTDEKWVEQRIYPIEKVFSMEYTPYEQIVREAKEGGY